MMDAVSWAFKEWAVVVEALRTGRQALILRKGGVAERDGEFRVDHDRFWLFPTYEHQNAVELKPEAHETLARLARAAPKDRTIAIDTLAEVERVWFVDDLEKLLALDHLSIWSRASVEKRFAYGGKLGLYVIAVHTRVLDTPVVVADLPRYIGCRTWVDLEAPVAPPPAPASKIRCAIADEVATILAR
ncbi:MAG: DUF1802 family protein [Deltaproteobacteria bacterium]|nr:DUF1802 family protein [Deltaproteobacteria bacterium]